MSFKSTIELKDKYSSTAKKLVSSFNAVEKGMNATKRAADLTKGALDKVAGTKTVKFTASGMSAVVSSVNKVKTSLNSVTGKVHDIKAKFNNSSMGSAINTFGGKLKVGVASAVGLGIKAGLAGAGALITGALGAGALAIKGGSELEQQRVSMTHFMGGDSAGADAFIQQLRTEANRTPFSGSELVQVGTRMISSTGGDTKQAMEFVKLAEDMAALSGGTKTVAEAGEAILDAQMGEFERLKEFGWKGSKEDFDAAGGNMLGMKGASGKTLQETFGGGAEKLSTTSAGLWSTIKGNVETGLQDAGKGILDALKPSLEKLIPVSEKLATKIPQIFERAAKYINPVVDGLASAFKSAWNLFKDNEPAIRDVLKSVVDVFKGVWEAIKPHLPVLQDLFKASLPLLKSAFDTIKKVVENVVKPAFDMVAKFVVDFVIPAFNLLKDILDNYVNPFLEDLGRFIETAVKPAFSDLVDAGKWVVETFNTIINDLAGFAGKFWETVKSWIQGSISVSVAVGGPTSTSGGAGSNGGGGGGARAATGDYNFQGGFVRTHELGGEIFDLPQGTRIYPADKSEKIMEKETKGGSGSVTNMTININVDGANKTNEDVGRVIAKEIKKLRLNLV